MAPRSTTHQRALEASNRAAAFLVDYQPRLSASIVTRLRGAAAALNSLLQKEGVSEQQLELIVLLKEAEHALWEKVVDLERRLADAEKELQHLRNINDELYCRSMAQQLENKLYRCCRIQARGEPPITSTQAASVSLKRIKSEPDTVINVNVLKNITKRFKNLEVTVGEMRELGNGAAHPWLMHDPTTGKDRPVTKEYLQACINRRYSESIHKDDAMDVLACLEYLSTAMVESLFVPITPQQAAEQAAMQASAQS